MGLLPQADGSGSERHYTDEHRHRILAIRALRTKGLRGEALAARLRGASEDDILELAGLYVPPPPPPPAPVRSRGDVARATDTVITATADALDLAPKRAKLGLEAAIAQMIAEGLSVNDVAESLAERRR